MSADEIKPTNSEICNTSFTSKGCVGCVAIVCVRLVAHMAQNTQFLCEEGSTTRTPSGGQNYEGTSSFGKIGYLLVAQILFCTHARENARTHALKICENTQAKALDSL